MPIANIESLDQEGRGVAHVDGKVIFIEGALPGERVEYVAFKKKPAYEFARIEKIAKSSSQRVTPKCPHFGVCGGCSMQHLDARAQVAMKQRVLEDNLKHIGKVAPESILPAIYGMPWEYRHRARLSAKYVEKKSKLLVGFREKNSHFVAEINSCEILPRRISNLLAPLGELVERLSIRSRMPQIEVAVGEKVDVLVLRNMQPLTPDDEQQLREFATAHRVRFFLQPKGPDSAYPFFPEDSPQLSYSLPEFGLEMPFSPTEFTQVNPGINRILVGRAVRLLAPKAGERIADLFCGLGNFSLAIARSGAQVLGIEGSRELVARAGENAAHNGIANAAFLEADLFKATPEMLAGLGRFDKMLIDPPRTGAMELVQSLGDDAPTRIVYVSCSPATLARDAGILVQQQGYSLKAAGVVNMFPHTSHVESIALFQR